MRPSMAGNLMAVGIHPPRDESEPGFWNEKGIEATYLMVLTQGKVTLSISPFALLMPVIIKVAEALYLFRRSSKSLVYAAGPSSYVRATSPGFTQLYTPGPPYATWPNCVRAMLDVLRPSGILLASHAGPNWKRQSGALQWSKICYVVTPG